jgi:putative membrane-bound dehydrogenase-like protein
MSSRFFCQIGILCLLPVAYSLGADPSEPPNPVPLVEAAKRMSVPNGFEVSLFVGEPDVVQPIAMTTDERGRLWVVECLSYPAWKREGEGRDRVLIFEDRDGDGRFDSRRVFWDKGRNLAGIAIGFGGVWLTSAPELIFIPDRNRDDVPDAAPEALLDGWSLDAKHNIVNGLTWGPDGWLYGCHGILADSKVGRPGAPDSERITMNCGVWRFHPTRRAIEVVAHGTTNPWGIAFDDYGQMFVANCVIKHLFHIIPGARYERMYGQDDNPYAFRLIESCADHIHWAGGFWKTEGAEHSQNDAAGGGHAHSGAMIYLGENWPEEYRNTFFTLNIHGHRINNDKLERRGSGYVAKHRTDLLKVNDPWFRGVSLVQAADGGVFMSDWCDAGECHDYEDIHRENGRIYKINYGKKRSPSEDLARLSDADLLKLQLSKNEWQVSHARRLLQERAAAGKLESTTALTLIDLFRKQTEPSRQLRAVWALHAMGAIDERFTRELLVHSCEHVRGWSVQLALEEKKISPALAQALARLAVTEPSPVTRLYLASALQRLGARDRQGVAEGLAQHSVDDGDPNLPLLIWYGIEPLISKDDAAATALLGNTRISLVRQFIAQRLALRLALGPLANAIERSSDPAFQTDVANGMFEALNGRRQIAPPQGWDEAVKTLKRHSDADTRQKANLLSVIFGDTNAIHLLRAQALNPEQPRSLREQALQGLVQTKSGDLVPVLQSLVRDAALRGVAIRGLAAFNHRGTPAIILEEYGRLTAEEKAEAINTLVSRDLFAMALLEAVQRGSIPSKDISPVAARQMNALTNPRVTSLVAAILGEIRAVPRDKAVQIARYKKLLRPEAIAKANRSTGRVIFNRACAACHTLFREGGTLAPELTGSQRSNLDYILENVIDPNAIVWNRYRASYFETADDRLISGLVLKENRSTVTIQTQTGTVTLPRNEIVARKESALSMMPEGLFETLTEQEILDLVAYLQSPSQVALPAGRKE